VFYYVYLAWGVVCLMPLCTVADTLTWAGTGDATSLQNTRIRVPPIANSSVEHGQYFLDLLDLVLFKTAPVYGPYSIEIAKLQLSSGRQFSELRKKGGAIDLNWNMTSEQREEEFRAVKVPLLHDLNSYRVFLILDGEQEKFDDIRSLPELGSLAAGQGAHWPDTVRLRSNGLEVVTSAQYELLFSMLASKRFDYFPRGLYEVWAEQKRHAQRGLVVEPNIMLYYPAPFYFFVRKENRVLAQRLEAGLKMSMRDGSFDALFYSVPGFKRGMDELQSGRRRVIYVH